ncbi:MAG: hypothetical protein NT080_03055 [Spirochaetes bacterium]|nr:hypothetical protein [Spirochaetota bacterium]
MKICCGLECASRGGQELLELVEHDPVLRDVVEVETVGCLGSCERGRRSPVVEIDGETVACASPEGILERIRRGVS